MVKAGYPWPFFVAMGSGILLFLGLHALFPTFPLFIASLGGAPSDSGLMTWAFALVALVTRPLAGLLTDRLGRKPVLVVGSVLFASGPLLYSAVPNTRALVGARAVCGAGLALPWRCLRRCAASQAAFVATVTRRPHPGCASTSPRA